MTGLSGMACADTLTAAAFTAEFARALQAAIPTASVAVVRDLQIVIQRSDRTTASLNLDNAYRDYSADPKRLESLVRNFVKTLAGPPAAQPAKIDRAQIVPVIKDRPWLAELDKLFKKQGSTQQPLFDDFNKELVVVFAEDTASSTRYLSSTEEIGVARGELRALAIGNLRRLLPKIEMHLVDETFAIITAGGEYEASLLLIDDIWTGGQLKVAGDIVVAIPAKSSLLITGSRNRKGLQAMRAMTAELAKGPYRLTDVLFVYRNGKFTKFGRN